MLFFGFCLRLFTLFSVFIFGCCYTPDKSILKIKGHKRMDKERKKERKKERVKIGEFKTGLNEFRKYLKRGNKTRIKKEKVKEK